MAYGSAECEDCGVILTKDELTKIPETRVIGSYSNGSNKTKTSDIYFCEGCLSGRIERARRRRAQDRRNAIIGCLIIAAIVLTVWFQLDHSNTMAPTSASPAASSSVHSEAANAPQLAAAAPTPPPAPEAPTGPPPTPPFSTSASERVQAEPPGQSYGPEIADAVLAALASGQPQAWNTGSDQGWVIVSTLGGRDSVCRKYQVARSGSLGPTMEACKSPDGGWRTSARPN